MKNSPRYLHKITILFHPLKIRPAAWLVGIQAGVKVANPNSGSRPPPHRALVLVLVAYGELKLSPHPILVSRDISEPPGDVVEYRVFAILLVELIEVEEASEIGMFPE